MKTEREEGESEDVSDVEFIIHEVIRFSKMDAEDWKIYLEELRNDHSFCGLYSLEFSGKTIYCGPDAWKRFDGLAERLIHRDNRIHDHADLRVVVENIRKEFCEMVWTREANLSDKNVSKMLSLAARKTASHFSERTHFLPCVLFSCRDVREFSLGPVRFQEHALFLEKNREAIEEGKERIVQRRGTVRKAQGSETGEEETDWPSKDREFADYLADRVEKRFEECGWVATVKIGKCSESVSKEKANLVVKTSLDFLKLFLGSLYTDRLSMKKNARSFYTSASMVRTEDGDMEFTAGSGSGYNHLGDGDWTKAFEEGLKLPYELAGDILNVVAGFSKVPPLMSRFLDSLHWYGDAVTENNLSAKILKYVTALERLIGTGEEKLPSKKKCDCPVYRSTTEIVTRRSALLYCHQTGEDYETTVRRFKKIYDVRSELTHGSLSPTDPKCRKTAEDLAEIVEVVLKKGLCYFGFIGLDSTPLSNKKLKSYFDKFEDAVEDGFFEKES